MAELLVAMYVLWRGRLLRDIEVIEKERQPEKKGQG
jgi:hypothetical protein